MKIGQAAKKSGLTTKTVRYYANISLVFPEVDPSTGYRKYKQADVAKMPGIIMISPHSPQIENKYLAYNSPSQLRAIL